MKKSSLNRKFRRALAASLGAVAFASTSCVINAVDPELLWKREVAKSLGDLTNAQANYFSLGTQNINNAVNAIAGKALNGHALTAPLASLKQIKNNKDYEIQLGMVGSLFHMTVRLKRLNDGNVAAKCYRLCPDIPDDLADTGELVSKFEMRNRWARNKWHEYYTTLDNQIKALQAAEDAAKKAEDARRAEENARAERERANSLMNNSGNQNVQVPSTNFNSGIMSTSTLAAAMMPMTYAMTNNTTPVHTTPVHTTTSSMVNNVNTMGTQVGSKADINNTNPQISQNAQKATDKFKT